MAGSNQTHCYSVTVPSPVDRQRIANIRTVFLDRDGVINRKAPEGSYVSRPEDFLLLAGVPEAIARLNRAGLRTIVVSNQRGVALGLYSAADVDAIHGALKQTLTAHGARLDASLYCPHDNNECRCRKPLPGMFEEAVRQFPEICADESVMIGDALVDVEFGRRLGMATILIEGDAALHKQDLVEAARMADWRVNSLPEAVDLVLGGKE
jgi:D-glycero-D-manno-heptose 1,7-bisphosphate phosphatase